MQIQTNQKQRELKDHGTFAFPVNVSHENLFSYERSSFFWHWHPEIELTLIVSGDINYQVNDESLVELNVRRFDDCDILNVQQ